MTTVTLMMIGACKCRCDRYICLRKSDGMMADMIAKFLMIAFTVSSAYAMSEFIIMKIRDGVFQFSLLIYSAFLLIAGIISGMLYNGVIGLGAAVFSFAAYTLMALLCHYKD